VLDRGKWCQFYGILTSVMFRFKHRFPAVWEEWQLRLGSRGIDSWSEKEVEDYLGQIVEVGGIEGFNLL
jgi:hypothetical protein